MKKKIDASGIFYYNPKDWVGPIFRFHKSDTFRALFAMLAFMALYTWGVVYWEIKWLRLSETSFARNLNIMHNLLGFAISMVLVYRTNTAYDRWWEGRKLWGALMNNSRNLAIKLNVFLGRSDQDTLDFFRHAIPLYAEALRRHLAKDSTRLQLDAAAHPELPDFNHLHHVPNKVAESILARVNKLYKEGVISGDQLIVLNEELRSFTDICGGCERIKNTPIPFSYSAFIKKFIFIYVATLPFGFAFSLGYFAIPVTTFIFYVLASLELIAEEIEDPFGEDNNDLPMETMAANIRRNVEDILG